MRVIDGPENRLLGTYSYSYFKRRKRTPNILQITNRTQSPPSTTPSRLSNISATSTILHPKPPRSPSSTTPYRTTIPNNTRTSAPNDPIDPAPTPGAPALILVVAIALALPLIVPEPIIALDFIALIVTVLIIEPVPVAILVIIDPELIIIDSELIIDPVAVAIGIVSVILAIISDESTGVPVLMLISIVEVDFVGRGRPPGMVGTVGMVGTAGMVGTVGMVGLVAVAVAMVLGNSVGRLVAEVTTPLSPQAAKAQRSHVCGLR